MTEQLTLGLDAVAKPVTGQALRVLRMLERGPVCGTDFLQAHIARYSARIYDLRRMGFVIETMPCDRHKHESRQILHILKGKPVIQQKEHIH